MGSVQTCPNPDPAKFAGSGETTIPSEFESGTGMKKKCRESIFVVVGLLISPWAGICDLLQIFNQTMRVSHLLCLAWPFHAVLRQVPEISLVLISTGRV